MRFPFRQPPGSVGATGLARPVVDVWLENLDETPVACLVDTGAAKTRFAEDLAEVVGVDLEGALEEEFAVGGALVTGRNARVMLRLTNGADSVDWEASVWFCSPWPHAFQLLGLEGFLQQFRVCISAYEEWVECTPEGELIT